MLKLTQESRDVLKGEVKLEFRKDRGFAAEGGARSAKKRELSNTTSPIASHDKTLWEALRALRKSLADEKSVPAFVIFNDRALIAMCKDRPLNTAQFLAIDGVGPKKCEDYGEQFMSVIKELS